MPYDSRHLVRAQIVRMLRCETGRAYSAWWVWKEGLAAAKAEVRADIDDWHDLLHKGANSLLVAHGGAMVARLYQLKDYGTNTNLKHIGFMIAAFAMGFIIAAIGYIDVANAHVKLRLAVLQSNIAGFDMKPLQRGISLIYISVGILLLAVLTIAWRFFWL
jgi:hypothetical protein